MSGFCQHCCASLDQHPCTKILEHFVTPGPFCMIYETVKVGCGIGLASYPGSSPTEKRGESLEDLITCPVMYYAWFYVSF